MVAAFVLTRHGYRAANPTTPATTLDLGPCVAPREICMLSFQNTFAGDLLPKTLDRTLPAVVATTLKLTSKKDSRRISASSHSKCNELVYADSAISRCQETAVAWAELIAAPKVCGVPTAPDMPVDPRVNQTAAEKNLDLPQWIAAQRGAAERYRDKGQRLWKQLLTALGFQITSLDCHVGSPADPVILDGLGRALILLGLPSSTFLFATAVIMAFGLDDMTAFEEFRCAAWPHPATNNGQNIFHLAARLLGIVLAVRYPKGYVADIMSTALARFFVQEHEHKRFTVACTHEEHMNFFRAALNLGNTSYARPVSALVFVPCRDNQVKVFEVHNPVSRRGRVSRSARASVVGQVELSQIKRLAHLNVSAAPRFTCRNSCEDI
jgi:hypothetical protein